MSEEQQQDIQKVNVVGGLWWVLVANMLFIFTQTGRNCVPELTYPKYTTDTVGVQKLNIDRDLLECVALQSPQGEETRYTFVRVQIPAHSGHSAQIPDAGTE